MTLGKYIKQYRAQHNMGTREFARICGISRGYVGHLEREKNPATGLPPVPSRNTVEKVATGTGIEFDELVALLSEDGTTPYVERPSIRRPTQKGKQQILEFSKRPIKKLPVFGSALQKMQNEAVTDEVLNWKFDPFAQDLLVEPLVLAITAADFSPPTANALSESEETVQAIPEGDTSSNSKAEMNGSPATDAPVEVAVLTSDEPIINNLFAPDLKPTVPPFISSDLWPSIQMDIQSALAIVAHKYNIVLECHTGVPDPSGNIFFHLEVKPDTELETLQNHLFSLPVERYHEKDIEWCNSYLAQRNDFPSKMAWDSVCHLMGMSREDFGREVFLPNDRIARIIGADPALIHTGKTKRIMLWLRDIQAGNRIILDIRELKQALSEYAYFPYASTDPSQFFEYGEWLHWISRLDSHFTDNESGLALLPEDHHRAIRLGRTYYEICGVATLARHKTIILRNLYLNTLRKETPRTVLIALGRIATDERTQFDYDT